MSVTSDYFLFVSKTRRAMRSLADAEPYFEIVSQVEAGAHTDTSSATDDEITRRIAEGI